MATVKTYRPSALKEALSVRQQTGALPFAGGTDLMVQYRGYNGSFTRIESPVLFLDQVEELRGITNSELPSGIPSGRPYSENTIRIGAGCTLSEIIDSPLVPKLLKDALIQIASPALRNRATLAGNICNASPAADSLPPLYVLEAKAELASLSEVRQLPISNFVTGPGTTALKKDEILTAIIIPRPHFNSGFYRKVGTRKANALSKLSAAWAYTVNSGRIELFRFAVGAAAPTPVRLTDAETLLTGLSTQALDKKTIRTALNAASSSLRPIDDQRSSAFYRKQTALNILSSLLTDIHLHDGEIND